jgi:DNA-binding response OmpR family regulator
MNQSTKKTTIIYAEDSKSISTIVKHRLISEGYNVIHFATGEKIVEEVLKILPDIILLDNDMPVKDGLSILKELKAIPEVKDIPVIFLTSINERKTVLKCLELGASDYIVKDAMAINEILARISIRLKN